MRSLRRCHLPSLYTGPRYPKPKESGAYVPASAAVDPNLTDGARRCSRKLMEETHRRDRKERKLWVNVSKRLKSPTSARTVTAATKATPRMAWNASTTGAMDQVGARSSICFVRRAIRASASCREWI